MKTCRQRSNGFTIVEVAVAVGVLAIGLAGMVVALAAGAEMLDTARKQTVAAQIVQSEIERLRLLTWTSTALPHDLATTNQPTPVALNPSLALVAPAEVFSTSRTVTLASGRTDLRQVTLTVTWIGITGKAHSRSTNALIGRNGLNVAYQKF